MGVATAPLVGRAEELALLDGALAELTRGEWKAVELVGEPGIGKTRLLAELATRAGHREQLVLSGSASELERDLPFWVFVNALDDYVRGLDPRLLDLLDPDVRAELGNVFPSLSRLADQDDAVQRERYRTHRAVRELLERLTATGPLVLILDDVHWADPASVELLGSLLRRPPDAGVMIALAARPGQLPAGLKTELDRAHRTDTLTRVTLTAMTRAEADEFLGPSVDPATAATLFDESGGNPFYLEQLARSLERETSDGAGDPAESTADLDVPPPVASALADELALLSDSAHLLLQGAAVVGDPFEPELAGVAAGVVESVALTAVDELTAVGVIRGTEVPRRFRFRHPLVRRAVYDCAPAGWLLAAHERSAAALAGRGASATERAHHVERSGRRGDARCRRSPPRGRPGSRPPCPGERRPVVRRCTAAAPRRCARGGSRRASPGARGRARDLRPLLREPCRPSRELPARPRRRRRPADPAHHRRAPRSEHLLGLHEAAHQRLTDELAGLDDPASPEAVALMLELAVDGVYTMRFRQIAQLAERALETARPLGDPPADRHRRRRAGMGHGTVRARPRGGEVPRRGGRPGRRSLGPRPGATTGLRRPPRRRRALPGPVRRRRRPRGARDRRGQSHWPARLHPPRFHGPGVGADAAGRARRRRSSPRRGHRGVPTAPQRPEPGRNHPHPLTHRPGGRRPGARRQHGAGGGRPDPEHG